MFTFKVVNNPTLLKKCYEFRYEMMYENLHLIEENKEKIDTDIYDKYSAHFVAIDKEDNIAAYIRLIFNSHLGLPTPTHMKLSHDFQKDHNFNFAEFSRAYIDPKYRSFTTSKNIIYNLRDIMKPHLELYKIDFLYASLELNFLKFLKMIKINFQIIGEGGDFYGFRYPCVISKKGLLQEKKFKILK